jgi:pimeloyl-ACP methyl ester carboxylesterase
VTGPAAAPHWTEVDWRPYLHDVVCNGSTVRYLDIGDGPAILLVHGLAGTWRTWVRNLTALAESHRVIAVDLPGFGRSEPLHGSVMLGRLSDALAAVLEVLEIPYAVVVGHSMGGLVAERLALDHADRVRGLALICTGGVRFPPGVRAAFVSVLVGANLLFRSELRRALLFRLPYVEHAITRGFVGDPGSLTPELSRELMRGLGTAGYLPCLIAGTAEDFASELPLISCPTVIVAGGRDRLAPDGFAQRLAELIPHGELRVWDDVGHSPMLEQPERFNLVVIELADAERSGP